MSDRGMTAEWANLTLGDVVNLKRGYDLPKRLRKEGCIPLVSSSGRSDTHSDSKVKGPGVITGRYGTIGEVFYSEEDFWPLNTTLYVQDFKGNDPKFIYYFLKTIKYSEYSDKAAVPGVNRNHLHIAQVRFPTSLTEQKSIAHILGSLDDKIDLNRQINQTLESMAQALFKSWFVDFDPVIDNALVEGNDIPEVFTERAKQRAAAKKTDHQSDSTSAINDASNYQHLFPAEFEFTEEMGWVPLGWRSEKLSKLITIKHGFAFKGEFFSKSPTLDILLTPGNFKVGGGFKADKFKYYAGPVNADYILSQGELIVTMTDLSKEADTLGFPAIVPMSKELRYLHNQRLGKVEIIDKSLGKEFLYRCMCTKSYRDEVLSSVSGSTVKHTSPSKILAHQIAFSGGELESLFEEICVGLSDRQQSNNANSESLALLRDTLLPKLLSGELRIPDAEKLVQEVLL